MTTKEESLSHPRQLADPLGREADISGSIADIARRVSEQEEELAVSPEGVMHSDESGADQNHTDGGEQLSDTDTPGNVKAVRIRKYLQIMKHCPGTSRPVELALRDMHILAPSSLAAAMVQHGTAEYA